MQGLDQGTEPQDQDQDQDIKCQYQDQDQDINSQDQDQGSKNQPRGGLETRQCLEPSHRWFKADFNTGGNVPPFVSGKC